MGKEKKYTGVRLDFSNGYLLTDEIRYRDKGNRKFVCYKDYAQSNDIDAALLKTYLFEALYIDEQLYVAIGK